MATKIGAQEPQTETDLRVAVRMFHPGELQLIRFRLSAGIPHLRQLGDLVENGQISLVEVSRKLYQEPGLSDLGTWRDPLTRTRVIRISNTFNWEDFTKLFLDNNLLEAIAPYEE